jgi:hypothetical protein
MIEPIDVSSIRFLGNHDLIPTLSRSIRRGEAWRKVIRIGGLCQLEMSPLRARFLPLQGSRGSAIIFSEDWGRKLKVGGLRSYVGD